MLREYTLLEEGQGLRVNVAKLEDAGRYTCVAQNPAGRKDLDIPLDVWGSFNGVALLYTV